jgi:hypothetical protein
VWEVLDSGNKVGANKNSTRSTDSRSSDAGKEALCYALGMKGNVLVEEDAGGVAEILKRVERKEHADRAYRPYTSTRVGVQIQGLGCRSGILEPPDAGWQGRDDGGNGLDVTHGQNTDRVVRSDVGATGGNNDVVTSRLPRFGAKIRRRR